MISWTYYGNHFTMYVSQTIMLYALNIHSDYFCQLFLNKTGGKFFKKNKDGSQLESGIWQKCTPCWGKYIVWVGPKFAFVSPYLLPYVPSKRDPSRSPSVVIGMSSRGSGSKISWKSRCPCMGDLLFPELLQPLLGTKVFMAAQPFEVFFQCSSCWGEFIIIIQLINTFDYFLSWVKGERRETY